MISICSAQLVKENTEDPNYVYMENEGIVNIVCRIWDTEYLEQVDIVFAYDQIGEDKAYIFISMNKDVHPSVDDYMLKFCGDLEQVFPMEKYLLGDENKEMFVELKKKDLMKFLYELTHSNTALMQIKLLSEHEEDKVWVLEPYKIPEYINH